MQNPKNPRITNFGGLSIINDQGILNGHILCFYKYFFKGNSNTNILWVMIYANM